MNVPKSQLPEGMEERECHLYGLTGWFTQFPLYDSAFAFGGYFRYDLAEKKIVNGQLIDCFGPSSILEGFMDQDFFSFVKQYEDRGPGNEIIYTFMRESNLWVGDYLDLYTGKGNAKCVTYLTDKDGFYIVCGSLKS